MALKRPTEDQVIEGILKGSAGATKVFLNKVDSRVGHQVRARGYEPFIVGLEKVAERGARGKPRSMDAKRFLDLLLSSLEEVKEESLYYVFLLDRVRRFVGGDVSALLFSYSEVDRGGRPRKYSEIEFAALDIYLRDYMSMRPEQAIEFLMTMELPTQDDNSELNLVDRRFVQRLRKVYDHRYAAGRKKFGLTTFDEDLLLHCTGSLRQRVPAVQK